MKGLPPASMTGLRVAILMAAYIAAYWVGFSVAFVHGNVSPVWPPIGLAISALTVWGLRLWPLIAIGSLLANLLIAGNPPLIAAGITVGNTVEAVFGALVLRRLGVVGELSRVRDAIAILVVALLAPVLAATGGVLSLTLSALSSWERFPLVWFVWWIGDVMGALVLVPLFIAWLGKSVVVAPPSRPAELAGALLLAALLINFAYLHADLLLETGLPFLPVGAFLFPAMVWAAIRLRPREAMLVLALASGLALAYADIAINGDAIGPLLRLQMVLFSTTGASLLIIGAIAELTRAREALRAKEVRVRTIFEEAAVGIAEIGRDGRVLDVNGRLCEMLGYRRDELLGKSTTEVTDQPFIDEDQRLVDELFARRRAFYVIEERNLRKDGSSIWVRLTSSLPADADSNYRITIFEDIGKQQEAMASLQAAHARLELALRAVKGRLWDWDIERDRLTWSDEFYKLTGLDRGLEPTLETWLSTLLSEDRERASDAIKRVLANREPTLALEFRVRQPQTGLCWFLAMGQVTYSTEGRPLRMAGITIDITPLKRAEEEAVAANRAKSTFLAAASHDLRQPVQSMLLLISALSNRLTDHPAYPLVDKLATSLEVLQKLLGSLLDISRLDAGVITPEFRVVRLGEIIERFRGEYTLRAAEKGLELRAVSCARLWARTDPVLIERILRNLVENALRYTKRGKILIGCRRRANKIRFYVADTGVGIEREHRERVFNEFYQVGNPERDREKGLGLGLSIVRRLCNLLGHRLTMVSEPGRGTCFTIELSAAKPEGALLTNAVAGALPRGRVSVLVVEDNATVRDSLALILEDWGCNVLLAENAEEAVVRIGEAGECPDAILADYQLPRGRTGIDVARHIHHACGKLIPTLIMTGDIAPEHLAEAEASGFWLVHKPVTAESLREIIGGLVRE